MIEKDYYLDFKWLSSQKQWKAFQNYLDDEIEKLFLCFRSDMSADLKELQIKAIIMEQIKNSVERYVQDKESLGGAK